MASDGRRQKVDLGLMVVQGWVANCIEVSWGDGAL